MNTNGIRAAIYLRVSRDYQTTANQRLALERVAQHRGWLTTSDDFPAGRDLRKESWHFHRRFFAVFRRPMQHGEYSYLLHQIRFGRAEHLWEDCWRVRLPDGRSLPIRATRWRLITILPKNWQPPQPAPAPSGAAVETN